MADFSVQLKGSIYFFYRPKVAHEAAHDLADVQRFNDYRFIPLNPADFLYYPGAELVLLAKHAKYVEEEEVSACLEAVQEKDVLPQLEAVMDTPSIAPIIDQAWV